VSAYTAIDIFSGCGGLSHGLHKAGFDVRVAVEIDKRAGSTYKLNHPDTCVIQKDVKFLKVAELKRNARVRRSELDLLAGCPPCQGFSRIKTKNKKYVRDSRNDLIMEFLRLVRGLRPKTILLENVPGLARDHRFRTFLQELKALGYHCGWRILNAADYDVPQRRKRLILIASRLGSVELPKPCTRKIVVGDVIRGLDRPADSGDSLHKLHLKNTRRIQKLIKSIPKNGGSRSALKSKSQLKCHQRLDGFKDVYGRMKWDDVSPTLTGGCFNPSKGRFLHPRQNRAISMREAAMLQTFPRQYRFPVEAGLIAVSRMIGDAVPPKFAAAQAKQIANHLKDF